MPAGASERGRVSGSRHAVIVLLGCAATLGFVRSILESHFTQRQITVTPAPAARWTPLTKRVALVVLDGLRAREAFDSRYMPALTRRRSHAAWGTALSSEITMTVTGVRMLGAGVSSDFIEIFNNWNPAPTEVPSLLRIARQAGLRRICFGDYTWRDLFQNDAGRMVGADTPALIYYRDPRVPEIIHLQKIRKFFASGEPFDLMVIHLVGPDHASHRARVTSRVFREYLQWLDPRVDELLDALLERGATVVLTSDHGMSDAGQHGGDEPGARRTPFLLQGPGVRPGAAPLVDHADIPTTIAALLGLPLPPASEGRVLREHLDAGLATLRSMMQANLEQAHGALLAHQRQFGGVPPGLLGAAFGNARTLLTTAEGLDLVDRYLRAARQLRRDAGRDSARTWPWLLVLFGFAALLLQRQPAPPPAGLLLAVTATVASAASWITPLALWPAAGLTAAAVIWWTVWSVGSRLRSAESLLAPVIVAAVIAALLLVGGFLGFNRQFRSETLLGSFPDPYYRAAGYLLGVVLVALSLRRRARLAGSPPATPRAWSPLLTPALLALLLPYGQPALHLAPGLALGFLWLSRLERRSGSSASESSSPALLLVGDWLHWAASLVWVALDTSHSVLRQWSSEGPVSWLVAAAPIPIAGGALFWLRGRFLGGHHSRRELALATAAVLLALPALGLGARGSAVFNSLAWSSGAAVLMAMILPSGWSPALAVSAFALSSLLGSTVDALYVALVVAVHWSFAIATRPGGRSEEVTQRDLPAPIAALSLLFCWLSLHLYRDGSFSFSSYEVSVAFLGNPTHDTLRGAVQVYARFILPLLLLLLPLVDCPGSSRGVLRRLYALLFIHLGWLVIGFLATRRQFYTPYRLAGEAAHYLALVTGLPLLFGIILGWRGARARIQMSGQPCGRKSDS